MNTVPRVAESMDDLQVGMLIASVLPGDNRQEVYGGTIEAIDGDYAILVQPSFSGKFQTVRFHDPPHSVVILADPPALVDAVERGEQVDYHRDPITIDNHAPAAPPSEPLCQCGLDHDPIPGARHIDNCPKRPPRLSISDEADADEAWEEYGSDLLPEQQTDDVWRAFLAGFRAARGEET